MKKGVSCALATVIAMCVPNAAWAQAFPINSDVALQPAEGQWIYRTQGRFREADVRATTPETDLQVFVKSEVLVYGWTNRFSTVVGFPFMYREMDAPTMRTHDFGVGDVRLLARYQVWKKLAYLESRSWTVLAGLEIPSYDGPFSSRSWDPILGTVYTWRKDKWGFDADVVYQINTTNDRGTEAGDVLRYDVAVQRRVWPEEYTADTIWTLTALLELNGEAQWSTAIGGAAVPGTTAHQIFVSPGIVLAGRRTRIEAGVQIPVYRDVGVERAEDDIRGVVGFTWTF